MTDEELRLAVAKAIAVELGIVFEADPNLTIIGSSKTFLIRKRDLLDAAQEAIALVRANFVRMVK